MRLLLVPTRALVGDANGECRERRRGSAGPDYRAQRTVQDPRGSATTLRLSEEKFLLAIGEREHAGAGGRAVAEGVAGVGQVVFRPAPAAGPGLLAQPAVVLPLPVVEVVGRTCGRGRADTATAACGLARGTKGDRAVEAFGRMAFLVDGADRVPRVAVGAPHAQIAPRGLGAAAIVVIELACGGTTARLFDLGQAPRPGSRSACRTGPRTACGRRAWGPEVVVGPLVGQVLGLALGEGAGLGAGAAVLSVPHFHGFARLPGAGLREMFFASGSDRAVPVGGHLGAIGRLELEREVVAGAGGRRCGKSKS